MPFKLLAHDCADWLDISAQQAAAANTLVFGANGLEAWNTDGVGLINDLTERCNLVLEAKKILILGAGGAAQGIIGPLLDCAPASLTVANRTRAKAAELARRTVLFYPMADIRVQSLQEIADSQQRFDLIINSTSLGLDGGDVNVSPELANGAFCYDLSYGAAAAFARWAQRAGASGVADGLGMLV